MISTYELVCSFWLDNLGSIYNSFSLYILAHKDISDQDELPF